MRKYSALAVLALAQLGATATGASAQTAILPKDELPPGGLTIAGPSQVVGASNITRTIWQSPAGVNICVSAISVDPANRFAFVLHPSNLGVSVTDGQGNGVTLCAPSQTSVTMSGARVFWRIDRSS